MTPPESEQKSACCGAEMRVCCGEDFGHDDDVSTCYWACEKCGEACDPEPKPLAPERSNDSGEGDKEMWKDIIYKDGKIDEEQVMKELLDYSDMMDRFAAFLCEATGGKMSELNYTEGAMRSCFNDHQEEIIQESIEEETKRLEARIKELEEENKKLFQIIKDKDEFITEQAMFLDCLHIESEARIKELEKNAKLSEELARIDEATIEKLDKRIAELEEVLKELPEKLRASLSGHKGEAYRIASQLCDLSPEERKPLPPRDLPRPKIDLNDKGRKKAIRDFFSPI